MTGFLLTAGVFILLTVLLGLVSILRGPGDAVRLMAVQLLGTGGVAALLLLGSAIDLTATTDLALVLALLSGFAAVAFSVALGRAPAASSDDRHGSDPPDDSPAGD